MLEIVTMHCTYTVADVAANVLQISAWDSEKRHSLWNIKYTTLRITENYITFSVSINGLFANRFRHFEKEFRKKYLEISTEQQEHETLT